MLESLDSIDVQELKRAHDELRTLINELVANATQTGDEALHTLYCTIWHQDTLDEHTASAVQLLIEQLQSDSVQNKDELLLLLAYIARGNSYADVAQHLSHDPDQRDMPACKELPSQELDWLQNAHNAVAKGIQVYLALLEHDESIVRACAAYTVGCFREHAHDIIPRLRACIATEEDVLAKSSMLLGLSALQDVTDVLDKSALYEINRHATDNEFSRPRSARCCHPERSEGSVSMGTQMLRCAQHDRTGFDGENSLSAPPLVTCPPGRITPDKSGVYTHTAWAEDDPLCQQLLAEILKQQTSPLVTLAAAMALARLAKDNTPPEAIRVLVETIVEPGPTKDLYAELPWANTDIVGDTSNILYTLGPNAARIAIPMLVEALGTAGAHSSLRVVDALLHVAFNGEPVNADKKLTDEQGMVLRTIANSNCAWVMDIINMRGNKE